MTYRLGVACALFALMAALGLWILARGTPAFDDPIVHAVARLRATPDLWRGLTFLGDWQARLTLGIGAAAWLWRRGRGPVGALLLATVLVQTLANSALKAAFARPRPEVFDHLDYTWDLSYPSGHSAQNACLWLLLVLLVDRRLALVGLPLVLGIGVSRVVLGVHWPSDVIGGWAVGAGFALLGAELARRLDARR